MSSRNERRVFSLGGGEKVEWAAREVKEVKEKEEEKKHLKRQGARLCFSQEFSPFALCVVCASLCVW